MIFIITKGVLHNLSGFSTMNKIREQTVCIFSHQLNILDFCRQAMCTEASCLIKCLIRHLTVDKYVDTYEYVIISLIFTCADCDDENSSLHKIILWPRAIELQKYFPSSRLLRYVFRVYCVSKRETEPIYAKRRYCKC